MKSLFSLRLRHTVEAIQGDIDSSTKPLFGMRLRLFLAAALPALLAVLVLFQGYLSHFDRNLGVTLRTFAAGMARQVANSAEFPLFADNQAALEHLVAQSRLSDPQVVAVSVWSLDGTLRVSDGPVLNARHLAELEPGQPSQIGQRLVTLAEVRSTVLEETGLFGEPTQVSAADRRGLLGYVLVEIELSTLQQQRRELLEWALLVTGAVLLFAGLLSVAIASSVTRPLGLIAAMVARLREGGLGARIDSRQTGVLRPLADGINSMAARLAENEAQLQQRVLRATDELRQQKEAAERSARIDPLTGLLNRRAFTELAEREIQRARRFDKDLSMIAIDLDRFKSINDTHGHLVGDAVLEDFARVAAAQLRSLDVIARLGGEEFVVLLPGTDLQGAALVAERMRLAIAGSALKLEDGELRYTASFGVAGFEPHQPVLDRWLGRADDALYEAKAKGRNRVELARGRQLAGQLA